MPGCINEETSCSHLRAVYYFAESLSGTKFSSNYCKSYEDMLTENFDSSKTSNMGGLFVKNWCGFFYTLY